MKTPRFAALTLTFDTERMKSIPISSWDGLHYLMQRLMLGETVADSEFEHYGIRVTVREAVTNEIIRGS